MDGGEKEMRVTLENGVTLEFDSTGMMEDFRECSRMARESGSRKSVGGSGRSIGGREKWMSYLKF